ncbi:hypothetical protein VE02_01227 [Pseudogymnoascus sp. 03VT05]|nr:hypothetical protein VE02_01227 [Pseudogymnoascus sp. 03VT05]
MALRDLTTYALVINIFISLGSITYGYFSSIIATTLGQPGFFSFMNLATDTTSPDYAHNTKVLATVNGLYSAGGAVGCLAFMWIAEQFGRLRTIQLGALIAILGGALQGGAANIEMFYAGRFIAGLAVGMLVSCTPLYMSELSAPSSRGRQVGIHAIFLVIGYFLASWIGVGCYFATSTNPSFAWRFSPLLSNSPSTFVTFRFSKGSRKCSMVIEHGRREEAWTTLQRIHAHTEFAKEEFHQMTEQIKLEEEKTKTMGTSILKFVFTKASYRKRMIVGFLIQFGQEMGGILVINNYAVLLYQGLGQRGAIPLILSAVWVTTAALIYNPLGAWLHDKVNSRRGMYLTGNCGEIVTLTVGNGFAVFMIFLYLTFQGTFCDTTMYLYVAEIFPYEMRTIGIGFSLFGQFAGTLIVVQSAPITFASVGWKFYLLFILWLCVYAPFIYWYMPETARLTLEEIGEKFGDEVAVRITDAAGANEESRKQLYEMLEHSGKEATDA